ncbi:hypothetical protein [Baaleninema sp.]|uniref:hypothetical protein n=1 Tax=Baaleninema sp. TaxID=3101197 RepID=UPI003CFE31D9
MSGTISVMLTPLKIAPENPKAMVNTISQGDFRANLNNNWLGDMRKNPSLESQVALENY